MRKGYSCITQFGIKSVHPKVIVPLVKINYHFIQFLRALFLATHWYSPLSVLFIFVMVNRLLSSERPISELLFIRDPSLTQDIDGSVVMDKSDYHEKMDALVNDKQTYEELKRDPAPALQRKLNITLLTLKKTNVIDTHRYYRLRCSVPQLPNFMVCRNYTNLVSQCDLLFPSVVLRHTNCPST